MQLVRVWQIKAAKVVYLAQQNGKFGLGFGMCFGYWII
jgi:hypothetical protein